jgi:hypothetical protein
MPIKDYSVTEIHLSAYRSLIILSHSTIKTELDFE